MILSFILLLLTIPAAAGVSTNWQQKVEPRLLEAVAPGETEFLVFLSEQADVSGAARFKTKAEKGDYVFRRLTETAHRTQAPVLNFLQAHGLAHRPFWIGNLIWFRGDLAAIESLAQRPEVARVVANPSVRVPEPQSAPLVANAATLLQWNLTEIRAPQVWARGFTGQGVVVGGQDTGYRWDHPALLRQYRGWNGTNADHNYNWHDAIHQMDSHNSGANPCGYNLTAPCDDSQHGTHTMGIMVGDDGAGNQIGVAPGARWIGCRNMERGWGSPAAYIESFQWFLAPTALDGSSPDPAKAPDVINNSWDCPAVEGCSDPLVLQTVIQNVRAAGIVVVVSAGNSGPGCSTIATPPTFYDAAFSVGATDQTNGVASFSSRGPVTVDDSSRLKPNVCAPGVGIVSSVPGGYAGISGTSMAAPHAAGLVALLISAHPELRGQVDGIERVIEQTALPLATSQTCGDIPVGQIPNNTAGWGRVDAFASLGLADTDSDGIPDWWEIWHGLDRSDPSDAAQDADGDGLSNLDEFIAGTDPRDAVSRFRIESVKPGANCAVAFRSALNRLYGLAYRTTLTEGGWMPVSGQTNIAGTGLLLNLSHTNAPADSPCFYRVQVQVAPGQVP